MKYSNFISLITIFFILRCLQWKIQRKMIRSLSSHLRSFSTCTPVKPLPARLECDYLIVGGGPVGSSIAYHLAKSVDTKTHKIIVLERDFCYRTTSAMLSAGGIRQQFSLPENIKICMYGAEFIKDPSHFTLPGENEPLDIQFHENGYLFLAGERSRSILQTNHQAQHQCGATWIDFLEKQQLKETFPWLNTEQIDVGTFGRKNEGYFDPWAFVNALKKKSISLGVEYIEGDVTGADIQAVSKGGSSYNIEAVHFNQGKNTHKVSAHQVINAAGAWSGRLLQNFTSSLATNKGIRTIPVAPRARSIFGVSCRGDHPNGFKMPPPKTPLVVDPSGVYFRPEGKQPGKFIAGVSPTEEEDFEVQPKDEAATLQTVDDAVFEEKIWPVLAELVPAFEQLKVTCSWTGFYDYNSVDQVNETK